MNLCKLIISNKNYKLHFTYICIFCKIINGFKVGSGVGGWGETQDFILPDNADLI